jgi:hypothetical protein
MFKFVVLRVKNLSLSRIRILLQLKRSALVLLKVTDGGEERRPCLPGGVLELCKLQRRGFAPAILRQRTATIPTDAQI